ncbi:MAG: hypothetical protein JSW20_05330 [Nitrospiraceae bacterium]|nr:MAG: hypothetical protein JSW20_05330 [Nitrospiraceae bacterium]
MNRAYIYGFALIILSACASTQENTHHIPQQETASTERMKDDHIRTDKEQKTFDIFQEIFSITRTTRDRQSVLPRIESLYMQIIRDYPETPLAQESHWRLIIMYVKDYSPPDFEKADMLYHDFVKKYHDSPLRGVIEDTLAKSYVKHEEWGRLLTLCSPSYRGYVEKKITPKASLMFMYAEAHYHLGNMEQAEQGYSIVSELFPKLMVGKKSKFMIQAIENNGD